MATPDTQRKKRVPRNFCIKIRPMGGVPQGDGGDGQAPKTKPSNTPEPKPSSLVDDFSKLLSQKLGHWALVVEPYPIDEDEDEGKGSERFVEICTEHTVEVADDSDQSDRYEDDEEEGLPKPGGFDYGPLGMRIGRAPKLPSQPKPGREQKIKHQFAEPGYEAMGGVCWKLLASLKSRTRFTNSEIRKEADRIWKRQADYRLLDNNCQRFCILLAIHIRAKQSTFLRLLHAKTVKNQSGKGEKVLGKLGNVLGSILKS